MPSVLTNVNNENARIMGVELRGEIVPSKRSIMFPSVLREFAVGRNTKDLRSHKLFDRWLEFRHMLR